MFVFMYIYIYTSDISIRACLLKRWQESFYFLLCTVVATKRLLPSFEETETCPRCVEATAALF